MIRRVKIEVFECRCEQCGHGVEKPWYSFGEQPPRHCPKCGSREWDGKKVKRKPQAKPKIALPKPTKVRSEYEPD